MEDQVTAEENSIHEEESKSIMPLIAPLPTEEAPVKLLEEHDPAVENGAPKPKRKYTWSAKCEAANKIRSESMKRVNIERARRAKEYTKMKEETDKLDRVVDNHVARFVEKLNISDLVLEQIKEATVAAKTSSTSTSNAPDPPTQLCPVTIANEIQKRISDRFKKKVHESGDSIVRERFRRF